MGWVVCLGTEDNNYFRHYIALLPEKWCVKIRILSPEFQKYVYCPRNSIVPGIPLKLQEDALIRNDYYLSRGGLNLEKDVYKIL